MNTNIPDFIILAIATYYAQRVLRFESGPYGIFDLIRERVFGIGVDWNPKTDQYEHVTLRSSTWADMVQCVYCFSFWVALVITCLWFREFLLTYSLAVAGAAVVVNEILHHGNS